MIKKEDLRLSPHILAAKIFKTVTYGIDDSAKGIYTGFYARFLMLGAFIHIGALPFKPGMNTNDILLEDKRLVEFINGRFNDRYGNGRIEDRLNLLPSYFTFKRLSWQRKLSSNEVQLMEELETWFQGSPRETILEAQLLALGLYEYCQRISFDFVTHEKIVFDECNRAIEVANVYMQELTGPERFFKNGLIFNKLKLAI